MAAEEDKVVQQEDKDHSELATSAISQDEDIVARMSDICYFYKETLPINMSCILTTIMITTITQ